jgi:hypothetical protein
MRAAGGRRAVLTIYLISVSLAGLFGYILGAVVLPNAAQIPVGTDARIGPLTFPLDGPSLAVYGMVSIGTLLGIGLLAVTVVSRYDDAEPGTGT